MGVPFAVAPPATCMHLRCTMRPKVPSRLGTTNHLCVSDPATQAASTIGLPSLVAPPELPTHWGVPNKPGGVILPAEIGVPMCHCCAMLPEQSAICSRRDSVRSPPSRHRPEFGLTSAVPLTTHFCATVLLHV